ncbi:MAG: hypothetical protein AAB834_01350 [Patescibacteria group bacterium]
MNTDKTILIASSSLDIYTYGPIARDLTGRGYDVVTYESDKVAAGTAPLCAGVDKQGVARVSYSGVPLELDMVAAAWYRRPNEFSLDSPDMIGAAMNPERALTQENLWDLVPEDAWLNAPGKIERAEGKLTQLRIAAAVGFCIAPMVISNEWDRVGALPGDEIVFKTTNDFFKDRKGDWKVHYTTPFPNDLSKLPLDGNPFPGLWQTRVEKGREWRVTVIGNEAFAAAVHTSSDAKDDWRKHQLDTSKVRNTIERFPDAEVEKCFSYLGKFGLKFGAFDFIEEPDGNLVFLECNPNGQYGWLEEELGLPISSAIASELAGIADTNMGWTGKRV